MLNTASLHATIVLLLVSPVCRYEIVCFGSAASVTAVRLRTRDGSALRLLHHSRCFLRHCRHTSGELGVVVTVVGRGDGGRQAGWALWGERIGLHTAASQQQRSLPLPAQLDPSNLSL